MYVNFLADVKKESEERKMMYDLECRYDARNSFYGKAQVLFTQNKNKEDYKLYSYDTLVARITIIGNKTTYYYFGKYSQTTTRHQKEFFKQNGLTDKEVKKLFSAGMLIITKNEDYTTNYEYIDKEF